MANSEKKTITREYTINAPLEKVYQALINPKLIQKWSGSPAVMSAEEGKEFQLWEGGIIGKNLEVSKDRIVQDWKEKQWKDYSKVTFKLTFANGATHLLLQHELIPASSFHGISKGWDEYYLGPLKELLESE